MTKILMVMVTAVLFSCNSNDNAKTETPITKPVVNITPTKDQQARRLRSEDFCKSKNIPIYKNPNSLFVDPEEKVTIRTKDEVVDRAIALCYLELKSEKADKEMLADFDKRYNVMSKLTPLEKEFALAENPTAQQVTDANWRAESYHVMLWALGYIDKLSYPNEICNIGEDVKHLFSKTEKEFRAKATLRTKTEILDQADLILRLHWASVNEKLKPVARPSKEDMLDLDKSVVFERHHSLNWLINYRNQDWDKVTTDT
jgi:Domain of unknown function (DUF4272)